MYLHPKFRHLLYLVLAIIISACTPATSAPTPTPVPGGGAPAPEVYEPVAGSSMTWVDGSTIVYIPPGEFEMGKGSDAENAPAHVVNLDGFWINQTEVTNRSYARCVAAGTCTLPKLDEAASWYGDLFYADYPVAGVDWAQAQTYCNWAQGVLPTEAQWEMAAAGPTHTLYPWGDTSPDCSLLNFNNCLIPSAPDFVGSYPGGASFYGLLDMGGNVFEWVADFYAADYYPASPVENPIGPAAGSTRVVRGGGFDSPEMLVRTSTRGAMDPALAASNIGFRCTITTQRVAQPTLPICRVSAYLPRNNQGDAAGAATPTPVGAAGISVIGGYCDNSAVGVLTGINIDVGQPVTNPADYTVTAYGERLQCVQTPGYPNRLTCYGANVGEDSTIVITICPPRDGQDNVTTGGQPGCPQGYTLNPLTGQCEYTPATPPDQGCPPNYTTAVGANDCLPQPDPTNPNGGCPEGYFSYVTGNGIICVPPGGDDNGCTYGIVTANQPGCPPDPPCLPGYTYNAASQCCQPPEGSQPGCPQNYTFASDQNYCQPAETDGGGGDCVTFTVYIPSCVTPVPTRVNCSQFTTETSCNAYSNSCYWYQYQTGGPGECRNR
ncbi:MAG: hypothetical protein FD146_1847 [Anaerolineaceae bacterium]|nr:MAG: hypothetical protein FD146_1847 [Anaerolineaceae bacterium]